MDYERAWRRTLDDIRRVATRRGRSRAGLFAIEGTRLHERALRAGRPPRATLVAERVAVDPAPRTRRLLNDLAAAGCAVHRVADAVVDELTAGRDIGALVGLVALPPAPRLDQCLAAAGAGPTLLAAVDVEEPGNVGALLRTALAAGASAFLATGISDPYHPKAVRTSMGALFKLPVLTFESGRQMLAELQTLGVTAVGAVSRGGVPLPEAKLDEDAIAVLIGGEAFGLDQALVEHCVTIPMDRGVDSFSVNAAAAVVLYERARQRRAGGSPCAGSGGALG